jgi:hypothetical protein
MHTIIDDISQSTIIKVYAYICLKIQQNVFVSFMGKTAHRNVENVWIQMVVIKQQESAGTGVGHIGQVLNVMVSFQLLK